MNLIRLSSEHSPFAVLFIYFIVAFADAVFMVFLWSMKPIAVGFISFSLVAFIPTVRGGETQSAKPGRTGGGNMHFAGWRRS